MRSVFRRVFFPTKEEQEQQKNFIRNIHNKNKVKRGCTTCANCVHVRDYPGFVTGEECECSVGLECDTVLDSVRNCERYIEYDIEKDLNWEGENDG